jgi:hypothetical protein
VPGNKTLEYELKGPKRAGYAVSREVLSQYQENYTGVFKHIDSKDGDIRYFEIDDEHFLNRSQ